MTETTCPGCGRAAAGRFCPDCGVALDAECRECGNRIPAGGRFCNECGAPASAGAAVARPGRGASVLPWAVAGAAIAALAVVLILPRMGGGDDEPGQGTPPFAQAPAAGPATGPAAGPPGDARSVDLSTMTPREQADRLFNRVMQNLSQGDTAGARTFLPMAIAAYGRVETLDLDGRYHLAVLQLVGADAASARAQADTILRQDARHLFGLFTAAQAEGALGNKAASVDLYERFVAAYDSESKSSRPEYQDHRTALPPMKEEAERVLAGR